MCCILSILVLLGPRFLAIFWWISNPARWDRAFSTALWPILGILVAPWTTLAYVSGQPGGFDGFDLFIVALAVIMDIASYAGGGYGNRDRMPAYAR